MARFRILVAAAVLPLAVVVGATALPIRGHDCADVIANAFVYQYGFDARGTFATLLTAQPRFMRHKALGSGAWSCLTPGKRQELAAAGIESDRLLAEAAVSHRRAYDEAERLGTLARPFDPPIVVYRLSRVVLTHDLVVANGPLEELKAHLPSWMAIYLGTESRVTLQPVQRSESSLLLILVDQSGKVDRFGFVDEGDT